MISVRYDAFVLYIGSEFRTYQARVFNTICVLFQRLEKPVDAFQASAFRILILLLLSTRELR